VTTKRFAAPPSEPAMPFWEATKEQRLVLQWCLDCEQPVHFPREVCPRCLGSRFDWRDASGEAEVYSVVVEHRADEPFAVALVDLPEGVRMLTNVVGLPAVDVTVGMPVKVTWEALEDGRNLPLFEPR
jgi:uncharacterized OB-fold protein